jgi:AbrB family looped-hinge helix DNA binding protein
METVTISPEFQVVIPKKAREVLGLQAGHKIQVVVYNDRIELIPVRPVRLVRGFLKGINTDVKRETDRL